MSTLEEDLNGERRHLRELRVRADRRLKECQEEAATLLSQGRTTAADGDTTGATGFERRVQKLRARASRYEDLLEELDAGGDRLVREILLARLQGPESDLLAGEADRNRELIVQRATNLLRSRDRHRSLRQRWVELNDKIRALRQQSGLPAQRLSAVDFKVHVTPANYVQKPDGPTYREVGDLVRQLGL